MRPGKTESRLDDKESLFQKELNNGVELFNESLGLRSEFKLFSFVVWSVVMVVMLDDWGINIKLSSKSGWLIRTDGIEFVFFMYEFDEAEDSVLFCFLKPLLFGISSAELFYLCVLIIQFTQILKYK